MNVTDTTNTAALVETATTNVRDMVTLALEHKAPAHALIIYDTEEPLARILTEAYRAALPDAIFIDFSTRTKEEIITLCSEQNRGDLVVLIQSSHFRLDEFRIRLHLFQKGLKVIEHMHLYRNTPDSWGTYINALAYDPEWYRGTGRRLKSVLEKTETLRIVGNGTELHITGGVDEPKLNIGDYTGMDNIGGTFPIGEVFTEAKELRNMHGALYIYAFADASYLVTMHEPFRVDIEEGLIVGYGPNTPQSFVDVLELVKSYERPLIREVGFGLNRAITREHYVRDITAFERIHGLHISLGEKHSVYKKQGITTHKTKFHVDLFPVVDVVYADETPIFKDNTYLV